MSPDAVVSRLTFEPGLGAGDSSGKFRDGVNRDWYQQVV